MSMRIAFIIHRTNFYKIFGPVIDAALGRGWAVECWLLQEAGGKQYLLPEEGNLPRFGREVVVRLFANRDEIGAELRIQKLDVVMALYPKSHYLNTGSSRALFVTLQSGIDTFVNSSLEQLSSSDLLCLYAPFWAEWAANYYELKSAIPYNDAFATIDRNSVYPGAPQLDQFARLNSTEIRRRLDIPLELPVVLLLPITLGNKDGSWPRFFEERNLIKQFRCLLKGSVSQGIDFFSKHWTWPMRRWNDQGLTQTIKKFAKKNNALLIVKGREKDPIRNWTKNLGDRIAYDETYYPATIYELMAISDVCLHFYSTAVLESAYANVFGITIDRPSPSVEFSEVPPIHHAVWRIPDSETAFNFPGVNTWMNIPQVMTSLEGMSLEDMRIDPEKRRQFNQKYLGFDDSQASSRLLEVLTQGVSAAI